MLRNGKGRLDPDMAVVLLCSEMKWTYEEYINQPAWFLDLLALKTNLEGEYNRKKQNG